MHLEIRKAGKKTKYYLAHSYRKGGKTRKMRIYLGRTFGQASLTALRNKPRSD